MGWVFDRIPNLVDIGEAETPVGRALLEERYRVLQRQVPLLYTVALANYLGLYLATGGRFEDLISPSTILLAVVVTRLVHWIRGRHRILSAERILREMRKTWCFAFLVSVGFSVWALALLKGANADHDGHVVMFGTVAAIGCAYGLSSFPSAARLPLLLLGLPLAIRLILSGQVAHVGMGVSTGLVILLILQLLALHNRSFCQLVESRSAIAAERERARRAERQAKAEKTKAKLIADTDPLTGLANRRAFLRALTRRAAALQRSGGSFALAVVDLDGFKPINDTFGHATGDAVLEEVGVRLKKAGGAGALIARTGGDEFALLLPEAQSACAGEAAAQKVCGVLAEPFRVDGREFRISGCCGISLVSAADCNATEALIRADTALYRAKETGRSGVAVYSAEMDETHRRRNQIEQALRHPETQAQIGLVYQPIQDLTTGELRAFEALARWQHPELGSISPSEFIPAAEQINVIKELSDTLLAQAAVEAGRWAETVRLSFNLSAVQLCTEGSAQRILAILRATGMSPHRLQVEVTETALLVDFTVARENLKALRSAGARIVLDDFGAGHASISYLREMQFDGIKLDGSLTVDATVSLRSRRLLKGVVDLCSSLGLPCVAEHIETEEQRTLLREFGCRDGQGFLLARPLEADAAAELATPKLFKLGKPKAA
ncbi:MAG TPA: EAL domain-containing protein [Allosphingosinicella sp.]|jgi:diguanylate cyclase (GGDEF)-like protein